MIMESTSSSKSYLPLIARGNMDFMMNAKMLTHASITVENDHIEKSCREDFDRYVK